MTSAGDVSSSKKSAQTLKCLDFSHDADVSWTSISFSS